MNLKAKRDYENPRKIGIIKKNPCTFNLEMYRTTNKAQEKAENFDLPFGGKLSIVLKSQQTETEAEKAKEEQETEASKTEEGELKERQNEGKLILDATCAPADINYPTDLKLLNQARERTEKIIDQLYEQVREELDKKPRTYRRIARKDYLELAKQR